MRKMIDSGVEWLGDIPETWDLVQLGSLFSEHKNKNTGMQSNNLLSLSYGNIIQKDINTSDGLLPESFEGYNVIDDGDIVLRLTDLQNDQRSLRVGLSHEKGIVTSAYVTLRKRNPAMNSQFFYYLIHSYDVRKGFYGMGAGVRQGLNFAGVRKIMLTLPSADEQTAIADFLGKKIEQVDTLIANVQTQIEKLKAYKQSVITEVITKGLDPTVPMKDSELLWFGNIPQHWKLAKVKLFASTCSGGTPPSGDMSYYDGDVNWVCSYDLHETEITETGKTLSEKGAALIAGELQSPNSILIAMYGGSGTIGNSGFLKCYARTNQAICSVHFDEAVLDPRFAFYQTMFIRKYWMYYAVGTRKDPNISQDVVRNMKYVIPPIEEQKSMVALLDEKCSQIDSLLAIKQAKIEKLEQYKRSLIYEYVTGKKEVQ